MVPDVMAAGAGPFARSAWRDLGEPAEVLDRVVAPERLPHLPSPLPLGVLAADAVAVASLAVNVAMAHRASSGVAAAVEVDRLPVVTVDSARVRTSFSSERVLRVAGVQPQVWSDRSGFFRAADGWVRVHGNYPHHAERLCAVLGLDPAASPEAYQRAISRAGAQQLEDDAASAGAVVVRVRERAEWLRHPQGAASGGTALLSTALLGSGTSVAADPRAWPAAPSAPLSGIRVLDLCRVIAGPVGTRVLAQAGADVLRVDSPALREPDWQHHDTGQGKRSTLLDLRDASDLEAMRRLLASADVVVTGYRPGALDRFGLGPSELAERYPGIVVGTIAAWDRAGPWARRRGFDSIVQAASGIAQVHAADGKPGALPAQVLDHSSGYLLAAALVSALARQRRTGGTHHVAVTLDRVASHLLASGSPPAPAAPDPEDDWTVTRGVVGDVPVQCARPPAAFAGATEDWPAMARPHGADPPEWSA